MRIGIRLQTVLLFVPLLACLAAAGSALILWGHRTELRWGLEEQARSIAVATAEFLAAEDLGASSAPARIAAAMARIAADNGLSYMALSDGNGTVLARVGEGLIRFAPALPSAVTVHGIMAVEEHRLVAARAPVAGSHLLTLELRADAYGEEMARVQRLCLLLIAAGVLAGLVSALAVSGRIATRLKALGGRMRDLSERRFQPAEAVTGIEEVEDLDNALRTMHSVLKARRAASERLSIENEQFRSVRDLAATLGRGAMPDIDMVVGGVRVVARRIGGETGQLLRLATVGDTSYLLLGVMPRTDAMRQSMRAGALAELIAARLGTDGAAAVITDLAAWGLADRLLILSWPVGGGNATLFEMKGGSVTRTDPAAQDTFAVGVLTGSGERLLQRYIDRFPDVAADERISDLSVILERRCVGVYALIAPA